MKRVLLFIASIAILLPAVQSCQKGDNSLKVISYNVRNSNAKDGDNNWENRKSASAAMIAEQKPDIFGVQEALPDQLAYLDENCPDYKYVGVPRDDGKEKGEVMAIFWNTKTQEMIKWGNFWLSETPEEPSFGWDARCRRTATWALLKDKKDKKNYYYVNTHLDHRGIEARAKGLSLIVDRIKDINPEGYPMILTGDFNVHLGDSCLLSLVGRMVSAREVAAKTDSLPTYNGWGNAGRHNVIDYIYESDFSAVPSFETITKTYLDIPYISDHYPIVAVLEF
ncbi:MAG: endonuclease/exonuclease/phosphatase family protein [Bacteroidales bacterium]|nr:endonuclease/exonuclease/phosphatase family protein [Bacteroidales bacterium]